MRWDPNHESPDIEDRRGQGGGGGGLGGLLWLLPLLLRSPIGWVVLIVIGIGYCVSGGLGGHDTTTAQRAHGGGPAESSDPQARDVHFVGFVLDDVQSTWSKIFDQQGKSYRHAKLVLFTDATQTGCGYGQAATGPFYCPNDEKVYIDLGFWRELSQKLGAKGEFAQAYVVAHEVGHHVQKLLGTSDKLRGLRHTEGESGASVRLELQADCYAGVWAHSTAQRDLLENGDLESALNAAAAVGDDRLQKQAKGRVAPESFTHGTSEQRSHWFKRGYEGGDPAQCDTFGAGTL